MTSESIKITIIVLLKIFKKTDNTICIKQKELNSTNTFFLFALCIILFL